LQAAGIYHRLNFSFGDPPVVGVLLPEDSFLHKYFNYFAEPLHNIL
jgi:hypothetical protein